MYRTGSVFNGKSQREPLNNSEELAMENNYIENNYDEPFPVVGKNGVVNLKKTYNRYSKNSEKLNHIAHYYNLNIDSTNKTFKKKFPEQVVETRKNFTRWENRHQRPHSNQNQSSFEKKIIQEQLDKIKSICEIFEMCKNILEEKKSML